MQAVGHLVEEVRGDLLPMFVDQVDFNRPRSQREALDFGVDVSAIR